MKNIVLSLLCFQAVTPTQQGIIPADVSLIELIANPTKYHEKKVVVRAFLTVRFEDDALYLTREDSQYLLGNAVWVSFSTKAKRDSLAKYNNCFVEMVATFDKDKHGHGGAYKGTLSSIESIAPLRKWYK